MKLSNDIMIDECISYFSGRSVFDKVFAKMKKKYESLGHFGGNIVFNDMTMEEKWQLGGFLGKNYLLEDGKILVSFACMQKALEGSKFSSLTWEEILEAYYKKPLIANKDREEEKRSERELFFDNVLLSAGARGKIWLKELYADKADGYKILYNQYKKDKGQLEEIIKYVLKAVENLPIYSNKIMRLPVFAADITGNPHYFDENTIAQKLLLLFIKNYLNVEEVGESRPERKNSLLYYSGIMNDDLSNYVLIYGMAGRSRDGSLHGGMKGFMDMKEPYQLTLLSIRNLSGIECNELVYVVENPSFFSELIEYDDLLTVVCTNGQIRLSAFLLLDLLAKRQCRFLYAGDFDPEGLVIAQKLKTRYGSLLSFWNYTKDYYLKSISDVCLNETRLKALVNVTDSGLSEIKGEMLKYKQAGYQENIVYDMLSSISLNRIS